jgi:hypothetical protein
MMIEEAGEGWLDSNVVVCLGQSAVVNNGAEPWIFCSESPKRRLGRLGQSTPFTGWRRWAGCYPDDRTSPASAQG